MEDEEYENQEKSYMQEFYKYENKKEFFQPNDSFLSLDEKMT